MCEKVGQTFFLMAFILGLASCKPAERTSRSNQPDEGKCCRGVEDVYRSRAVLNAFAETLTSLAPDYRGPDRKGFVVDEGCVLAGSFIFDLSDTLNTNIPFGNCIKFQEDHFYHFSCVVNQYAYSNIAVLNAGQVKIFRAINCPGKGDSLQDVIKYLNQMNISASDKEELTDRLQHYSKYGFHVKEDPLDTFECK